MASKTEVDYFASSDEDKKQTLADLIIDQFLPEGCVDELVTRDAVIKEIFDADQSRPIQLTGGQRLTLQDSLMRAVINFVLTSAKKVFAITLISGLNGREVAKAMKEFEGIGITDDSLPLSESFMVENVGGMKWWSKTRIQHFCHERATSCPSFTRAANEGGAFGQVFQVKIHLAHQRISMESITKHSNSTEAKFAIKELRISGSEEIEDMWEREVATLKDISGLSHPNLIQCIAAVTRGKQRCLMFLWADGGNLRDLWSRHPTPTLTSGLVKDVIQQLRGIAEAIRNLHEYNGQRHYRHGDMKPENILSFPNHHLSHTGTLVISDFGSAQYHGVATRLRERTGAKAFTTKMYEAPESVTQRLSATSRLYDVWSMGCVTLEFLVWLLYGYEKLTIFNESIKGKRETASSFFTLKEVEVGLATSHHVAHIHPAVKDCLATLSKDPECTGDTALAELLDIVKTKLLVVELPERDEWSINVSVEDPDAKTSTSQPFRKRRSSAANLVNALNGILHNKKANDDRYWFTGKSRQP